MNDATDFSQWARQWEALMREGMARVSGADAGTAGPRDARAWTGAQGEALERMLAAGQGYLGLLQSMASAGGGTPVGAGMPPWLGAFAGGTGFAPTAAPWFANPLAQAMRGLGGHGAAGMEQWMQRFSAAAGPLLAGARGALEQPAFGFLREHQEEAQASAEAMVEYQEQVARYNRLMLRVAEGGFARFQLKLSEREEPGRQVESAKALYDLWVDAAEEAYAEVALSHEFRDVYGSLVNAQMRVREHVQRQVERISTEVGVPTRGEVDTIGERLQALRREVRADREARVDIEALAAEVAALRAEVAALRDAGSVRPASNVFAFERPRRVPEAVAAVSAAKAPRRAPKAQRKAKSVPQVARPASRSTTASGTPEATPAHAGRKKAVTTERVAAATGKGAGTFAARMARFARANADADRSPVLNPKSKPAKR